jgi:hypothetical protein
MEKAISTLNQSFIMHRHLKDLDPVYANCISRNSVQDRISYCENIIDKNQAFISKNNKFVKSEIKGDVLEIINAAQTEIKILLNK